VEDVCDILVLTGEPPETPFPAETVHIPGLGYDKASQPLISPEDVAKSIIDAVHCKWADGCDVLHVHNPTLAKNRNFLNILKALQKKNLKLFLQIHDFAEDGRPNAYFFDEYVTDCHYGVINSRDYDILLRAGLKPQGLHLTANTINPFPPPMDIVTGCDDIVLYPVRAIRRKNIGEAILSALFFKKGETLCITQPPNSPADIASYLGWKDFLKAAQINVMLQAGAKENFYELVNRSEFILTTSITEGFGFSFLEPWTAGKLLWGRKLPDICRDFEQAGIRLDHLYTHLLVPLEWIGKENFSRQWRSCVLDCCTRYRRMILPERLEQALGSITKNGQIDFGLLNERFQMQVISRVLADRSQKKKLIRINPHLTDPGRVPDRRRLIHHNQKRVLGRYTQQRYRQNMLDTYARVMQTPVRHHIDKARLLSEFFDLESFSLLKWGDYVDQR